MFGALESQLLNNTVYCFTRDSPSFLGKSLRALQRDVARGSYIQPQVIVLDDSRKLYNRKLTQAVVGNIPASRFRYHGVIEQRRLLQKVRSRFPGALAALQEFIRPLGHPAWDLGAVRNYALLLHQSRSNLAGNIIFIDDDILLDRPLVRGSSSLEALIKPLQSNRHVISGGRLSGFPDCSLIERVYLAPGHGGHKTQPLSSYDRISVSGGLMAFDSVWGAKFCFPRAYDEDWFWMVCCKMFGTRIMLSNAQGIHRRGSSGRISAEQIIREQTGEAIFEGLRWATEHYRRRSSVYRALRSIPYWRGVVHDEVKHLQTLFAASGECPMCVREKSTLSRMGVLERARREVALFSPENLMADVVGYFENLTHWRRLCQNMGAIWRQ